MPIRSLLLLQVLLIAASASAATITLPLGGLYRPGRYMPVQIDYAHEQGVIRVAGSGAIDTAVTLGSAGRSTVPWLAISSSIQNLTWTDPAGELHPLSTPLHALDDHDRLVGFIAADSKLGQTIFAGTHIIPVMLDAGWTPEPAATWEALDAIVIGDANSTILKAEALDAFLLTGTTVAVVASEAPTIHHEQWIHAGPLWLLREQPLIAHDPINPDAYGPTYDWIRGRTPVDRARVLIFAIIISIAVVMIALWRSRWAIWMIVAICLVGVAVVFAYDGQRPKMLTMRLGVTDGTQLDGWFWYSPISSADGEHGFQELTKPIFASRRQVLETRVALHWSDDVQSRFFSFHLDHDQSLAFVDIFPTDPIDTPDPKVLPTAQDFVEHLYLHPGDRIAGAGFANHAPAIVITRSHSPIVK
jgi:hypothetical protein